MIGEDPFLPCLPILWDRGRKAQSPASIASLALVVAPAPQLERAERLRVLQRRPARALAGVAADEAGHRFVLELAAMEEHGFHLVLDHVRDVDPRVRRGGR